MIQILLPYHPPYHWENFLKFITLHLIKGVEAIENQTYLRTVRWKNFKGWLQVEHQPHLNSLKITLSANLAFVQNEISDQLKNMFDLRLNPTMISDYFYNDSLLKPLVDTYSGLRIPGAFDGFELAIRAILGQQISVRAATTLAGRMASAFGESIETPFVALTHLSPTPDVISNLKYENLTAVGILKTRANCILRLAQEVASKTLDLKYQVSSSKTVDQLLTLPGIGPWTAHYIALRALGEKDAFLKNDLAIRQTLGRISASQAEEKSQSWQPWRSYATLYLWQKAIDEGFIKYQTYLSKSLLQSSKSHLYLNESDDAATLE